MKALDKACRLVFPVLMRMRLPLCVMASALLVFACGGNDDDTGQAAQSTTSEQPATSAQDEEFFLADGTVVVRAGDPTFQAPATLPSGPTSFTIKNEGTFPHQMRMVRLDDDDPPLAEVADLAPKAIFDVVTEIGAIRRVKPGKTSSERIEVELEPGRYGFLCLFTDTYSGSTHAQFGMTHEFTVTE